MSLKILFILMLGIFLFSCILSSLATIFILSLDSEFLKEIELVVKQMYGDIPIKPYTIRMMLYIFLRNLMVVLISIALGALTVFLPSVIVVVNGVVLGVVIGLSIILTNSWILAVVAILPHGVLELPAVFLSTAYGTKLGIDFWKYILKKNREDISKTLNMLPKIIVIFVALLFCASFIETFVTPYLIEEFLGLQL